MTLKQFKKFLKANLTKKIVIPDVFSGTLIDAHNFDKANISPPDKSTPIMIKILEMFRRTRVEWWVHYDGPRTAWNMFQRNYSTVKIVNSVVPSTIIPFVREIETSQLAICTGQKNVYCSSCYQMRIENINLKKRIAVLEGTPMDSPDAKRPRVDGEPSEAPVIREWFKKNFHKNGSGKGYPRTKLRNELSDYLSESFGYRAEISNNAPLWKWFVDDVISDGSRQYRGFRIWKRNF